MKNFLRLAVSFLLAIMFSYSAAYSASFYYVDNSVASSGNGYQGSPWKNFSDINWTTIGSASKPCTILVSGGSTSQTYAVAAGYKIAASGSGVGSEVILKRATEAEWSGHGGTVIINGGTGDYTFNIFSRDYVIVDGFQLYYGSFFIQGSSYITIRNCWVRWKANQGRANGGIMTNAGPSDNLVTSYLTIQNNRLGPPNADAGDDPIIPDWSQNWIIEGNIIENVYGTSGSHADGIHIQGTATNMTIRYNWFSGGFKNAAIYMNTDGNRHGPHVVDVYGNIFENGIDPGQNTWQGINFECLTDYAATPYDNNCYVVTNIYNNVFLNINNPDNPGDSADISIYANSNCKRTGNHWHIENNIFYNSHLDFQSGSYTSNLTLNNNWHYNTDGKNSGNLISWKGTNYSSLASFHTATGYEANHDVPVNHQSDPKLKDIDTTYRLTHDVRPVAGSPVIDVGNSTLGSSYNVGISTVTGYSDWPYYSGSGSLGSGVTTISRPQGSGWDIGAYEYSENSDRPSPPKNLRIVQ